MKRLPSGYVSRPSFNHSCPTEGTERVKLQAPLLATQSGFNHSCPTEGTESLGRLRG